MKRGAGLGPFKRIYDYGNFRDFIKDFYSAQKEIDHRFSFQHFSKVAGFKSKSFLQLVIKGQRNLTDDSIDKLAVTFKLNKDETFFFRNLVHLNQATTLDERQTYASQLLKSREYRKTHPLSESQFLYLSQWHCVAIRELVGLPEFREDFDWIAKRVTPSISPHEARAAVELLLKLAVVKRNESGRLVLNQDDVATPDEVVSAYAAQYHREMLKKAAESIDLFNRELREISAITFPMASKHIKNVKEIVQRCRKEIIELIHQDPNHDSVYQLNFQLFPLAPGLSEEKKK